MKVGERIMNRREMRWQFERDHGGPPFGLVLYGAAMKLFVFGAVVLGVALPLGGLDPWLAWGAFVGASLLLAVAVGVVESVMARMRLLQLPSLLVTACLISAFAALFASAAFFDPQDTSDRRSRSLTPSAREPVLQALLYHSAIRHFTGLLGVAPVRL